MLSALSELRLLRSGRANHFKALGLARVLPLHGAAGDAVSPVPCPL